MKLVAADVWQVHGPGMRMAGGVVMPLNTAVIRLADRSLLLYSPIKFDDAQVAAINAEGEVKHIVAPNLYHHLHLKAAKERWPHAIVHAPPGLAGKRSDLTIDDELGSTSLGELDVQLIGGAPRINETLLFHRPSGALLCGDFMFNVTEPANLRTRWVLAMMGVGGKQLKQSRFWGFLTKDREAARASIDRVLSWPIATVVPVHGEPVAIDANALMPKLSRSYGSVKRA